MTLEQKIKQLPDSAGVYQYFDKDENLLYIGKAKNLSKRVSVWILLFIGWVIFMSG